MAGTIPCNLPLAGGRNLYGYAIGILMIEGRFPRPPGAIGNATTFSFPVMHHVVRGASGVRTVRELAKLDPDSAAFADAIRPWTEGAKFLAEQGCRAITTSCGFAALFQRHLSASVDVPDFCQSLARRVASLDRWRSPVDPSQVTHCKQKIVDEFLSIAESTSGWR